MSAPYNGFTPEQRAAGGRWYNEAVRDGRLQRPAVCGACGQGDGRVSGHSEDYSTPYGPHIGAFPLCNRCHLAVHCRRQRPGKWKLYRDAVRDGAMFGAAMGWEEFREWWFGRNPPTPGGTDMHANEPRERTILDDIEQGFRTPGKATAMIAVVPDRLRDGARG